MVRAPSAHFALTVVLLLGSACADYFDPGYLSARPGVADAGLDAGAAGTDGGATDAGDFADGGEADGGFVSPETVSCAPQEGTLIRSLPIAEAALRWIGGIGMPSDWNGEPTPALTLCLQTATDGGPAVVRAPAAGLVQGSYPEGKPTTIVLRPCREVTISVGPVVPAATLTGLDGGSRLVQSGEELGMVAPDALQLRYAVDDSREDRGVIDPYRPGFGQHVVCPFQSCGEEAPDCHLYMSATEATHERSLVRRHDGSLPPEGTECGTFPSAPAGSAAGLWKPPDAELQQRSDFFPVFLYLDATQDDTLVLSTGAPASPPGPSLWAFPDVRAQGFFHASQGTAGSRHNESFSNVGAGPDGGPGDVFCYDGFVTPWNEPASFAVLLRLTTPQNMKGQGVPDTTCAELSDGGAWALPSDAMSFIR